jgi:hypothetical protein
VNDFYDRLYEAASPGTHPDQLVWEAAGSVDEGDFWEVGAEIADTDLDGRREIVVAGQGSNQHRILVYENDGDNSFVESYFQALDLSVSQSMTIGDDIDGDGVPEILYGGLGAGPGRLYVVESTGDNAYKTIWSTDVVYSDGHTINVSNMISAGDLDGDGRKEFVAGGRKTIGAPTDPVLAVVYVFEATGNDHFEAVASLVVPVGSLLGDDGANVLDVDGDGQKEIIFGALGTMKIFQSVGDNAWTEIWSGAASNPDTIGAGDHDGDGKAEAIFDTSPGTGIWEILPQDAADLDGDGLVDVVDNCPQDGNADQTDSDTDGAGDPCDCAPVDGSAFAAPGEVDGLRLGATKDAITWTSQATEAGVGTVYDVVRGAVLGLPVGSAAEDCLEPGSSDTASADGALPDPGEGFYYLVRAANVCGVGSYGQETGGAERITSACP